MNLSSEQLERLAHKYAGAKLGWFAHVVVYVLVNLLILAISQYGFGSRPWSAVPLLVWGVALALHGISVFLLGTGGGVRERLVAQQRERVKRHQHGRS